MTNEEFIESIRLQGEVWKTIPNWERYAVSTFGRIVAYSAPYKCGNRILYRKPKLMKPSLLSKNSNYLRIMLSDGNRHFSTFLVHRLIAMTFIPNPNNLPYINHKDENTFNNAASNLEWCTQKYNCNYGTHNARMSQTLKETAYQRKPVVQCSMNGLYIKTFNSAEEAARALGICGDSIRLCCRGKTQSGKGYRWMYLSDYEKSLVNQ